MPIQQKVEGARSGRQGEGTNLGGRRPLPSPRSSRASEPEVRSGPPGTRPAPRPRGAAAQAVLTGCRLWGNMAPAAAGLPRTAVIAVRLSALSRLHTRCAKGTGAATPAGRLPSAAAGSSGARRGSVPPPREHPPAAASFVAVVPRRAEGARERPTSLAWDGHHTPLSFAGASTGGRRPQRPGAVGRDPTGHGGRRQQPLSGTE